MRRPFVSDDASPFVYLTVPRRRDAGNGPENGKFSFELNDTKEREFEHYTIFAGGVTQTVFICLSRMFQCTMYVHRPYLLTGCTPELSDGTLN